VKQVLARIESEAAAFAQRPYFKLLEGTGTLDDVRILVPGAIFFVFAFQDMLRLNHERVEDSKLQRIAQQHRREDLGHDVWFLNDMKTLGVERDIRWVFSEEHRGTRDAAFELIAEVLKVADDRQRVAIPLALEAGGHAFFSRAFGFFERCGVRQRLQYFAKSHWEVEQSHEVFEDEQARIVGSIDLDDKLRQQTCDMVSRMFASMTRMVDDVCSQIEAARSSQTSTKHSAAE
jgi:hypothetical protein